MQEVNREKLIYCLQCSYQGYGDAIRVAEEELRAMERQMHYVRALVGLVLDDGLDGGVRQGAVLRLRNAVQHYWASGSVISDAERALLKSNVVEMIVSLPRVFRHPLGVMLREMMQTDFPDHWPELLPAVLSCVREGAAAPLRLRGALTCLHQMVKKYEFKSEEGGLRAPLEGMVAQAFPLLAEVFAALRGELDPASSCQEILSSSSPFSSFSSFSSAASSSSSSSPHEELGSALVLIAKIFYVCQHAAIPQCLRSPERFFVPWLSPFAELLSQSLPFPDGSASRALLLWPCGAPSAAAIDAATAAVGRLQSFTRRWPFRLKKWLSLLFFRLLRRLSGRLALRDEQRVAAAFREGFSARVVEALLRHLAAAGAARYPRKVTARLLSALSEALRFASAFAAMKEHLGDLVRLCLFELCTFGVEEAALWAEDPAEFVRRQFSALDDLYDPRAAAVQLLRDLQRRREPRVAAAAAAAVAEALPQAQEHPERAFAALYLAATLRQMMAKHVPGFAQRAPEMLERFALPLLAEGSRAPEYLRMVACRALGLLGSSLRGRALDQALSCLARAAEATTGLSTPPRRSLSSADGGGERRQLPPAHQDEGDDGEPALFDPLPVRVTALYALSELAPFAQEQLLPLAPSLFASAFALLRSVELDELLRSVEALTRVFAPLAPSLAAPLAGELVGCFFRLAGLPEAASALAAESSEWARLLAAWGGAPEDEAQALAAAQALSAVEALVDMLAADARALASLETPLAPLLRALLAPQAPEFREQGLRLLAVLTYCGPAPFSPTLRALFDPMLDLLDGGAPSDAAPAYGLDADALEGAVAPIDNFLSRDAAHWMAEPHVQRWRRRLPALVSHVLAEPRAPAHALQAAAELAEVLLQHARSALPPEAFAEWALTAARRFLATAEFHQHQHQQHQHQHRHPQEAPQARASSSPGGFSGRRLPCSRRVRASLWGLCANLLLAAPEEALRQWQHASLVGALLGTLLRGLHDLRRPRERKLGVLALCTALRLGLRAFGADARAGLVRGAAFLCHECLDYREQREADARRRGRAAADGDDDGDDGDEADDWDDEEEAFLDGFGGVVPEGQDISADDEEMQLAALLKRAEGYVRAGAAVYRPAGALGLGDDDDDEHEYDAADDDEEFDDEDEEEVDSPIYNLDELEFFLDTMRAAAEHEPNFFHQLGNTEKSVIEMVQQFFKKK